MSRARDGEKASMLLFFILIRGEDVISKSKCSNAHGHLEDLDRAGNC